MVVSCNKKFLENTWNIQHTSVSIYIDKAQWESPKVSRAILAMAPFLYILDTTRRRIFIYQSWATFIESCFCQKAEGKHSIFFSYINNHLHHTLLATPLTKSLYQLNSLQSYSITWPKWYRKEQNAMSTLQPFNIKVKTTSKYEGKEKMKTKQYI